MDRQQGGDKRVQKKVSSVDSDQVVCDELLRPSGGQHLKHQKQGSSLQRMSAGMCNTNKEWQRLIIYIPPPLFNLKILSPKKAHGKKDTWHMARNPYRAKHKFKAKYVENIFSLSIIPP